MILCDFSGFTFNPYLSRVVKSCNGCRQSMAVLPMQRRDKQFESGEEKRA